MVKQGDFAWGHPVRKSIALRGDAASGRERWEEAGTRGRRRRSFWTRALGGGGDAGGRRRRSFWTRAGRRRGRGARGAAASDEALGRGGDAVRSRCSFWTRVLGGGDAGAQAPQLLDERWEEAGTLGAQGDAASGRERWEEAGTLGGAGDQLLTRALGGDAGGAGDAASGRELGGGDAGGRRRRSFWTRALGGGGDAGGAGAAAWTRALGGGGDAGGAGDPDELGAQAPQLLDESAGRRRGRWGAQAPQLPDESAGRRRGRWGAQASARMRLTPLSLALPSKNAAFKNASRHSVVCSFQKCIPALRGLQLSKMHPGTPRSAAFKNASRHSVVCSFLNTLKQPRYK
ncbi:hypothetical protein CYMTET_24104 [Cymbomonas tetramitiformis]|uniref:Uncharacterized protein n=1 Tax=Cymbomonas tetramitiformis TaxID=36881 RepID=A0AAE0L0E7_9CHLO|nr:hypothetical protein CYMTET_24104 [Cymbomonas tetramitiformis]